MVSVILHGCSGHMGQVVTDIIAAEPDVQIVAGIDAVDLHNREYPVFTKAADCQVPADVIIDFSTAKAVDVLVNYGVERNIPIVLCTTGLSEEQIANIKTASEEIAILRSANMSIGVNLLLKLLREVSGTLTSIIMSMTGASDVKSATRKKSAFLQFAEARSSVCTMSYLQDRTRSLSLLIRLTHARYLQMALSRRQNSLPAGLPASMIWPT